MIASVVGMILSIGAFWISWVLEWNEVLIYALVGYWVYGLSFCAISVVWFIKRGRR